MVAAQANGARRLRRSSWHKPWDFAESQSAWKLWSVKRPQGRAPVLIFVGAQNTHPAGCPHHAQILLDENHSETLI
jgi:hypothetical protein